MYGVGDITSGNLSELRLSVLSIIKFSRKEIVKFLIASFAKQEERKVYGMSW
jgi:hypothetical protein